MEIDEKKIEFQADDFKFAHRLEAIDDEKAIRGESNFKEAFTNLRKNKGAIFGFFSILVIVFFACILSLIHI